MHHKISISVVLAIDIYYKLPGQHTAPVLNYPPTLGCAFKILKKIKTGLVFFVLFNIYRRTPGK